MKADDVLVSVDGHDTTVQELIDLLKEGTRLLRAGNFWEAMRVSAKLYQIAVELELSSGWQSANANLGSTAANELRAAADEFAAEADSCCQTWSGPVHVTKASGGAQAIDPGRLMQLLEVAKTIAAIIKMFF